MTYLEFEKPLADLEGKAEELRALARRGEGVDLEKEAAALDRKAQDMLRDLYRNLDPWRKTLVARHPDRPHCKDYVETLFTEWTPLAGDRTFGDDHAVMGGLARFRDQAVVVIGHEKGNDTRSRIQRNFGMARPEGYRKAIRLMDMADRFRLPVVTLVDTPGAYPGKGAEERGQSEAIARSTEKCLQIGVPLVSVITGEGGSGGAVAFASANRVAMLEHSVYSVISPEGCAAILWKVANPQTNSAAAEALCLTAKDNKRLGVIDHVIKEPVGGAHRDRAKTAEAIDGAGWMHTGDIGEVDADGFVKILADEKTDEVLGVHIIGAGASDLIAERLSVPTAWDASRPLDVARHGRVRLHVGHRDGDDDAGSPGAATGSWAQARLAALLGLLL